MERNDGIRSFLQRSWVYEAFQQIVGWRAATEWLCENHWKVEEGMTVVDVGCGPARLREFLPDGISYFGIDPNRDYIETARKRREGTFYSGVLPEFFEDYRDQLTGKVDVVICSGLLHHMSDPQLDEIIKGGFDLLRPGGRLVALEPTYLERQDRLSRWVLNRDRGTNIKVHTEWEDVLKKSFSEVEVRVVNRLIRIPYMYGLLTAWKE